MKTTEFTMPENHYLIKDNVKSIRKIKIFLLKLLILLKTFLFECMEHHEKVM